VLVVHIRDWLRAHHDVPRCNRTIEFAVQYIANALIGVLLWWVHNDFADPVENVCGIFGK
jgi:hypothetical protein